jgi:cytochrome c oxidase assembly factor CtaG
MVAIGAALAAVLFTMGWLRLRRRRRRDHASVGRAVLFAAGLTVAVVALVSPLDPVGEEYLLSVHMAQHLLLGDVAPLLIVLAITGPLALFIVPKPVLRTVGRNRGARSVLRFMVRPSTAVVVWVTVTAGWHIPFFFEAALESRWVHDLEHASFFLAGFLLWMSVLGAIPRIRMSQARRAALAISMFAVGMVVSQTLFLADPLYSVYVEQPERLFGLTPKADQVLAAMMMSAEQLLTLGTAAGLLAWAALEHAERRREDRQDGDDGAASTPDGSGAIAAVAPAGAPDGASSARNA